MTISRFNREVAHSAKEFSRQLARLSLFIEGSVDQVIRKACLDLWSNIVERTPFDTGRAKNNWSIDTTHGTDVYEASRSYNPHATFSPSGGSVIYIYNNLEYIEALEDGHSSQRPNGMVAVSLQEFAEHLNSEARRMGFE